MIKKRIVRIVFDDSHVLSIAPMEYGIADVIGYCGLDDAVFSSGLFLYPFSISLKLSPRLLSFLSCTKDDQNIPNKIEWFCFPSIIKKGCIM